MHEKIYNQLMSNCFGPRSVEVYGGAFHIAKNENHTFADIARGVLRAIEEAKYWTPEVSSQTVARRYCGLFFVDHMLVEALIGIRL